MNEMTLSSRIRRISPQTWVVLVLLFAGYYVIFRWFPHFGLIDRVLGSDLSFYVGTWALEPNSMVTGRLAQNSLGGIFSDGMSLGLQGAYSRQFGLAGWLLTLPSTALTGFSSSGIGMMVSLACALSAAFASAATVAIRHVLGRGSAVLLGLSLLLPWAVAVSRSMYWTIGIKLLPAAVLIAVLHSRRRSLPWLMFWSALFSAVAALSGYEYFTIVVACQLAVVAYYSVSRAWSWLPSTRAFLGVTASSVVGFVLALILHVGQLFLREGNWSRVEELQRSAVSRTGTGLADSAAGVVNPSSTSPSAVLDFYLGIPVLGVEQSLPLVQQFTVGSLILMTLVAVIAGFSRSARSTSVLREQALGVAWIVSLLGPLGWHLLARPHSEMHTFLNVSLWFLPTIPLGLALLWPPLRRSLGTLRHKPLPWVWMAATFVALALFFAFSQLTVK